jgi:4-hydroxybenzoate polyprenyltransferase
MNKFFRFIKIEHTLFSLPLIYAGVFLAAEETPSVSLLILVFLSAVGARTVAMTLNRLIDAEIDKKNFRTKDREIPAGRMSMGQGVLVLIVGLLIYFSSAYYISKFCLFLSPIPLLIFVLYPYAKRFTVFAHYGVGLGVSMAPLGGWFAVKGSFEHIVPGILITVFTILWATGFDVIYSTLDEKFDKASGLFSFPSRFGSKKALLISSLLHILAFIVLVALFIISIRSLWSLPFLLLSGFLLYLEQKKSSDVQLAFFKINAVIGFVVLCMVLTKGISL